MNIGLLILGMLLIVVAIVDALWTTLWVDGYAGPLSRRWSALIWKLGRSTLGRRNHRALSLVGPLALALTLMMWVVLLGAGWVLVFAGGEEGLISAHEQGRIGWMDRIYFVMYAMFTMGNGDLYPRQGGWQIAVGLTTATGMILVTLGISYILNVVTAVVHKRQFASQVHELGFCGEEIAVAGWDGDGFGGLEGQLHTLAGELTTLTERHLAYPILFYYHAAEPKRSSALAVVALHEALMLLSYGVAPEVRPSPSVLRAARGALESHLDSLKVAFLEPEEETPRVPDLARLGDAGIPTVRDEAFAQAIAEARSRRQKLAASLEKQAWAFGDKSSRQPLREG